MNASKIDPTQVRMVQELKHTSALVGARFDPTGRFVFAGAQDNTIQRWDLASGKKTALVGHKSWVRALAFAPKEKLLFSGDYAGRVLVWPADADDPKPLRTIEAHGGWVRALAVSGILVEKLGGPSVKPYHPPGLYEQVVSGTGPSTYVQGKGDELYRRSLYTYWKRSVPSPAMLVFDLPFRETCTVRRARTTTPLQALNLLNDPTYIEAARFLALE